MGLRSRRVGGYLLAVVVTTLLFTLLYNTGMAVWEEQPQPWYRSLEVVVQSFTTTGYGEDAPWSTPQMNLLMILMQLAGIGLILTAVDVFVVPWLRAAVQPAPPTTVDDLTDHVIICSYTPRTAAFVDALRDRDQPYVVIEPAAETARELDDADITVVHGDPEAPAVLTEAGLADARAVVADAGDDANASIVLAARERTDEVDVITLVTDAAIKQYHRAAGADRVLSPRQLLGEHLVAHLSTAVTPVVDEGVRIGEAVALAELTVAEDGDLCGQSLATGTLTEGNEITVIGGWIDDEFVVPVEPDRELTAGNRLLVAGPPDAIDDRRAPSQSAVEAVAEQRVVVAGYGDSGQAATDAIRAAGATATVIDTDEREEVDVVGDARDPDVLQTAGIEDADALVVTVGDDTTAVLITLIARELAADCAIVVRANDEANVDKLGRAGADYVQSLAGVSGRMLVSAVLPDEEVWAYDARVRLVRRPVGALADRTLAEAAVREETGCTVVAIERDGTLHTEFDPAAFRLQTDDELIVAGSDTAIGRFDQQFGD
jgi:Trk K+ transport system NAD-binding subunit